MSPDYRAPITAPRLPRPDYRNANNTVIAQIVRDGNIGGILSRTTNAGAAFYGYDGNGNVTLLTDASGTDVGHYRYDAFGNTLEAVGPRASENPYRFSTKEWHAPSGLYDYGLRFYSPSMGRWINRDPLAEEGGINLYGFVGNNPVNDVDTYGLSGTWYEARPCGGNGAPDNCMVPRDDEDRRRRESPSVLDHIADTLDRIPWWADSMLGAGKVTTAAAAAAAKAAAAKASSAAAKAAAAKAAAAGAKAIPNAGRIVSGITKSSSPVWKGLKGYKGNIKTNGVKGKGRRYYNWDFTHDDIEIYDSAGRHLGTIDGIVGKMTKPAVRGRTIDIK